MPQQLSDLCLPRKKAQDALASAGDALCIASYGAICISSRVASG